MNQPGAKTGSAGATDRSSAEGGKRCYQKHPKWHTVACIVAAVVTGFLVWWMVAEAFTADGRKVWWTTSWNWGFAVVVVASVGVGGVGAWAYRRWRTTRSAEDEDTSLFWLVLFGVLASVVLASAIGYAQAELLTAPGEPVTSLDSRELLDIARATTFALGGFGAVAVLLVNYRKQRSVESALRHDQAKHLADLAHENRKQQASEIAALHERYTKAVEQLADRENPAIRLGGVHALAALAEDWAAQGMYPQRQVCVDLVCSYLRNVPPGEVELEYEGEPYLVPYDLDYLEEDRDARKAALEWLSRLATADATRSPSQGEENGPPAVEIDLRGIVLHTLDLSYANLAHLKMPRAAVGIANLSYADLTHIDLTQALLHHTKFEHAVLNDATLIAAKMQKAVLTNAHLVGADLKGAYLQEADLVAADLTGAKLPGAQIDEDTLFMGAILDDADFRGVNVRRINLDGVDYSKAKNFELLPQDVPSGPEGGSAGSVDDETLSAP